MPASRPPTPSDQSLHSQPGPPPQSFEGFRMEGFGVFKVLVQGFWGFRVWSFRASWV